MIKWIQNKLEINLVANKVKELETKLLQQAKYIDDRVSELKEYSRVDADVGLRSNNTIILTGVYRDKGYVKFYDVGDGEFKDLVEHLRDMQKYALVRHIDKPPNFTGVFDILEG